MMLRPRRACLLLLALAAFTCGSAVASDGFGPFSLRELARQVGIGCGPGYHNKPCVPWQAVEHNKMLVGQRKANCLDQRRSQLSRRTPTLTLLNTYPGEYGIGYCRGCAEKPQPRDRGVPADAVLHPVPADPADPPEAEADTQQAKPNPNTQQRELIPLPRQNTDAATIEELLRGIEPETATESEMPTAGNQADRGPGYVPGQELWNRLGPDTRELFRREFPNYPAIPNE